MQLIIHKIYTTSILHRTTYVFLHVQRTNTLKILASSAQSGEGHRAFGYKRTPGGAKKVKRQRFTRAEDEDGLLKDRGETAATAATRFPHPTALGPIFVPISIAIPLPSSSERPCNLITNLARQPRLSHSISGQVAQRGARQELERLDSSATDATPSNKQTGYNWLHLHKRNSHRPVSFSGCRVLRGVSRPIPKKAIFLARIPRGKMHEDVEYLSKRNFSTGIVFFFFTDELP